MSIGSTFKRATELVALLEAAGIAATTNPNTVAAPCILIEPPSLEYSVASGSADATWKLNALLPSGGDQDTWRAAELFVSGGDKGVAVDDVLDVEDAQFLIYDLGGGRAYPCLQFTLREII